MKFKELLEKLEEELKLDQDYDNFYDKEVYPLFRDMNNLETKRMIIDWFRESSELYESYSNSIAIELGLEDHLEFNFDDLVDKDKYPYNYAFREYIMTQCYNIARRNGCDINDVDVYDVLIKEFEIVDHIRFSYLLDENNIAYAAIFDDYFSEFRGYLFDIYEKM